MTKKDKMYFGGYISYMYIGVKVVHKEVSDTVQEAAEYTAKELSKNKKIGSATTLPYWHEK